MTARQLVKITANLCGAGFAKLYFQTVVPRLGSQPLSRRILMKKLFLMSALLILVIATNASAQSPADAAAIKQTALDYIEGWYEGNPERMEKALHPELAKRMVETNPQGRSRLDQMSAMSLVQVTRRGFGKETPKEKQQKDVTILDVFENAASVKVVATDWVDYLHIAKFNGKWVIVNVLWELKPKK
jgi:hypothetical protein